MRHTPMTLLVGSDECFERECEEYATEQGDDNGIAQCSHIREETVCEQCSTELPDGGYDPVVSWPCPEVSR